MSVRVVDVLPLSEVRVLVFFEDRSTKIFDVKSLFEEWPEYQQLSDWNLFSQVVVEPGGYGIYWNGELDCSEGELYENGVDVPLSIDDFIRFAENNLVSVNDAASILNCSKQNVNVLIQRGRLNPVNGNAKHKLLLATQVRSRSWGILQNSMDWELFKQS